MICQECGWESPMAYEDDDCPMCNTPYTYINPRLVREGHRMPWMLYKLALKSPDLALQEVILGDEIDVVRGAELVLQSPWGFELDELDQVDITELSMEELLRYTGRLEARLLYWSWIQTQKGFAIPTGTEDYHDPMSMDLYLYALRFMQQPAIDLSRYCISMN